MRNLTVIALVLATVSCGGEDDDPALISLDEPVGYDILGFSLDERRSAATDALATSVARDVLDPLDASLASAGSALAIAAFGATRGDCPVGPCQHVYFELVDQSGASQGRMVVRDLYDDVAPSAELGGTALGPVTELPEPIGYADLAGWLGDQSGALSAALLSGDAQGHAGQLRAELQNDAASLVVRRFITDSRDACDDACRDTLVQLQRSDFYSLTPYTIATLRIRTFDDPANGWEVELIRE